MGNICTTGDVLALSKATKVVDDSLNFPQSEQTSLDFICGVRCARPNIAVLGTISQSRRVTAVPLGVRLPRLNVQAEPR